MKILLLSVPHQKQDYKMQRVLHMEYSLLCDAIDLRSESISIVQWRSYGEFLGTYKVRYGLSCLISNSALDYAIWTVATLSHS